MESKKNNELSTRELRRISKTFEGINKLAEKYDTIEDQMIVMDDYDGGYIAAVRLVIKDLKNLKKPLDKSEKSVIV